MNCLILDVETTISHNGNAFDQTNKLVCIGLSTGPITDIIYFPCSHEDHMYIQGYINSSDILVLFNAKFDLHWLRKIGINFTNKRIWDCQIGEFLLESQLNPYPSLNQACEKYGLPQKLDIVKTEYWDKNIDTDMIPREILSKYLTQDLILTEQVFLKQQEQFETNASHLYPLFKLQNLDLLVLEEMEAAGIKFNSKAARQKAKELEIEMEEIRTTLTGLVGNGPINWNSNSHISAILYGGTIVEDMRIPIGTYQTGAKVGHPRYKIIKKEYEFPRLVEPLKGTETKYLKIPIAGGAFYEDKEKPTHWKVNSDVLRSLKLNKKAKQVVDLLEKYGELEKLCGTYLNGWSDLIEEMNWPEDMIHGNLNQTSVITGRLSSTKPNLQNADPETKSFCETRYD